MKKYFFSIILLLLFSCFSNCFFKSTTDKELSSNSKKNLWVKIDSVKIIDTYESLSCRGYFTSRKKVDLIPPPQVFGIVRNLSVSEGVNLVKGEYVCSFDIKSHTGRDVEKREFFSPADGYITKVYISNGSVISPHTIIASVVKLSPINIEIHINEKDINKIEIGQRCKVTVNSQGIEFFSTIKKIYPELNPMNRTIKCEIPYHNREFFIKPGMIADVDVLLYPTDTVILHKDGLIREINTTYVYKYSSENKSIERLNVKIGKMLFSNYIEIKEGLCNNDKVVVSDKSKLEDGMKVNILNKEEYSL